MKNSTGRHAGSYTPLAPRTGSGAPRHEASVVVVAEPTAFASFPLFGEDAKFAAREDARK